VNSDTVTPFKAPGFDLKSLGSEETIVIEPDQDQINEGRDIARLLISSQKD